LGPEAGKAIGKPLKVNTMITDILRHHHHQGFAYCSSSKPVHALSLRAA